MWNSFDFCLSILQAIFAEAVVLRFIVISEYRRGTVLVQNYSTIDLNI